MHRGRCSTMQGPEAKSPSLESVRFSAVWNTGFRFPSFWKDQQASKSLQDVTSIFLYGVIRIDLNWKSERLSQLDAIRAETELMLCIGTRWYKIDKLWRNAWDADSRNVPHVGKKKKTKKPGELAPSSVGLVLQWKYKQWHRHRVSWWSLEKTTFFWAPISLVRSTVATLRRICWSAVLRASGAAPGETQTATLVATWF